MATKKKGPSKKSTKKKTNKKSPKKTKSSAKTRKAGRKNSKPKALSNKRKLTKAEQLARKPIEGIIKDWSAEGGEKRVRDVYRTLLNGYKRRVDQFKRKGLVSYAQLSYEKSLPKNYKTPDPKTSSFNKIVLEIARLQQFFKSATSNIAGIKALDKEQDLRIFGAGKFGRPRRTMTKDERTRYWELYDEFYNQKSASATRFSSETIQQVLAQALFIDNEFKGFAGDEDFDIVSLLDRVEADLEKNQEEENLEYMPSVYTGWGPFKR